MFVIVIIITVSDGHRDELDENFSALLENTVEVLLFFYIVTVVYFLYHFKIQKKEIINSFSIYTLLLFFLIMHIISEVLFTALLLGLGLGLSLGVTRFSCGLLGDIQGLFDFLAGSTTLCVLT